MQSFQTVSIVLCRGLLMLGTICAISSQSLAQSRGLVPQQPSVEVNFDSLRALAPVPIAPPVQMRPSATVVAPSLPPPPPPVYASPVAVPAPVAAPAPLMRRVPEQQYEDTTPTAPRMVPTQNPLPLSETPSVVKPTKKRRIKNTSSNTQPQTAAMPAVELPANVPAAAPAPSVAPTIAEVKPVAPAPSVPAIIAPPVSLPPSPKPANLAPIPDLAPQLPPAIDPVKPPVANNVVVVPDINRSNTLDPLPIIPPQPVPPLPDSVEKRLKSSAVNNASEGTISDKTVVKAVAPIPLPLPAPTIASPVETAEAKRLAEADKKSAELSAAKRRDEASAEARRKAEAEAFAAASAKAAAEKKMADDAAAIIAQKKLEAEQLAAKKKADAEALVAQKKLEAEQLAAQKKAAADALAAANKKKADDAAAIIAQKKLEAEQLAAKKKADAEALVAQKKLEAEQLAAQKKAAADSLALENKKKADEAAAILAQKKLEAEQLAAKASASIPKPLAPEVMPPYELPAPTASVPSEDKNILPKPAAPIVLSKSQMGALPKLSDVPADKSSSGIALPKLPDLAPARTPPALPSLTAITGEKIPNSMDVLQPRDGVDARPLAAPNANASVSPPSLPALPKISNLDGAIAPQRQLPDVDVTSNASKPPVASPLVAMPAAKSAPVIPEKPVIPVSPIANAAVVGDGEKSSFAFEKDKSDLSDAVKAKLTTMADGLKKSQGRARIVAYASGGAEDASVARRISLSRALQIRAFLISKGVNALSLNVQALGNQINADTADVFVK